LLSTQYSSPALGRLHEHQSCTAATYSTLQSFTISKSQSEAFKTEILKAIITGGVSFAFVENEHMKKAAKMVGIDLPSRKALSGSMIHALFDDTQRATKQSIADMDFPAGASDGWRKKYAQQGDSLMNFVVMGNEGENNSYLPALLRS
jgi:hypothetical protein